MFPDNMNSVLILHPGLLLFIFIFLIYSSKTRGRYFIVVLHSHLLWVVKMLHSHLLQS